MTERVVISWITAVVLGVAGLSPRASAQIYLTRDEALRQYFPPPIEVERKNLFLTDHQVDAVQTKSRSKIPSKIITYYVGHRSGTVTGYAFFETQTVRTMPAVFILVIDPDSSIRALEILAFYEPEDYLPPKRWLDLFHRKQPSSDLWLKRGIQNIVGATLSAQALTDAVRRYLALFEIAIPKEAQ
ncbi:MAG: hypothetical protein FJ215_08665 [Ignavibacteria bacterium]|nr:hypothetical protein [Ignavibacteria bacterium]